MTKWVIYYDSTKDGFGWIRLSTCDTRREARQKVKTFKQEDIAEARPYFKYRIVKEQV